MKIEDFIFAKMSQKNKTFLAWISFDISYKSQKFQKSYDIVFYTTGNFWNNFFLCKTGKFFPKNIQSQNNVISKIN